MKRIYIELSSCNFFKLYYNIIHNSQVTNKEATGGGGQLI